MKLAYFFSPFIFSSILFSCSIDGVKNDNNNSLFIDSTTTKENTIKEVETLDSINPHFTAATAEDSIATLAEKTYPNGIKIKWLKKGEGEVVKDFDMLRIAYSYALSSGKVYDGNQLLKKVSIAFPHGWNLQTKGWEFVMNQLKVGDKVEAFIPAALARGEKGIPGLVPPNDNNTLKLEIIEKIRPDENISGAKLFKVEESNSKSEKSIRNNDLVKLHYFASTPNQPRYHTSRRNIEAYKLDLSSLGDDNFLKKAMLGLKTFDKVYLHVPANMVEGDIFKSDKLKSKEDVLLDFIILDVE